MRPLKLTWIPYVVTTVLVASQPAISLGQENENAFGRRPFLEADINFNIKSPEQKIKKDEIYLRKLVKNVAGENVLYYAEPIPDLIVKKPSKEETLDQLGVDYGLAFQRLINSSNSYLVFQRGPNPPAPGIVRLYQSGAVWVLQVKEAPTAQVFATIESLTKPSYPIDYTQLGDSMTKDAYLSASSADTLLAALQKADLGFKVTPPDPKGSMVWIASKAAESPSMTVWPLTFLDGSTPAPEVKPLSTSNGLRGADGNTTASIIASVLNGFVGAKPDKPVATALGPDLLLQGKAAQVELLRKMLARNIDIPYSQVRLDVWTIQVNTKVANQRKERAQANVTVIRDGVAKTRAMTNHLVGSLEDFLQQDTVQKVILRGIKQYKYAGNEINPAPDYIAADKVSLFNLFAEAGLEPGRLKRPLTLAETLMFLEFYRPNKSELENVRNGDVSDIDAFLRTKFFEQLTTEGYLRKVGDNFVVTSAPNSSTPEGRLWRLWDHIYRQVVPAGQTMPRRILAQLLAEASPAPVSDNNGYYYGTPGQNGIADFLLYWKLTGPTAKEGDILIAGKAVDLPGKLSQSGAAADKLLKIGMGGLTADLQNLLTNPLLAWIRTDVQRGNADRSGIDLVGNTSLVVDARMPVQIAAQAQSFSPFTPLPDMNAQLLNFAGQLMQDSSPPVASKPKKTTVNETTKVSGASPNTTTEKTTETTEEPASSAAPVANAGAGLFGQLTGLQSLALASILNQPQSVYNKVAPGIGLGVRPTVLRDGGSARLQMSLVTNIDVDQPHSTGNVPFDMIRGHSLQTDVAVSAYDLFELSTFATQTSQPGDVAWRIPVLDGIPILGTMFRGPRVRDTKYQESMLIVNVTILPRAIDLASGFLR